MKNSVRRLLCAALALLLIFGTAGELRLPADEQAADESFLAILGLAEPDAAGHAAYAEEVPPEPDSGDPAPTDEPAPEASVSDDTPEEPSDPEVSGEPEPSSSPEASGGAPSDPDESDVPGDPQNSASPDDTTDEEITENDAQLSQGYARIASGSSADIAGILSGDLLLLVGDTEITSIADYFVAIRNCKPGDILKLTIYRCGRQFVLPLQIPGGE